MEHKELLIKDICSRLPYGLVIDYNGIRTTLHDIKVFQLYEGDNIKDYICLIDIFGDDDYVDIENIKPYLFPMSSMTEEQQKEANLFDDMDMNILSENLGRNHRNKTNIPTATYNYTDWLNKNHFDYRGLIEKGLAIDATNLNVY